MALATIGEALEQKALELVISGNGTTGLIVDAIGTIAVEQCADFIESRIRESYSRAGWRISRRYAPGYCGWAIEAQRDFFACIGDTQGIRLTDSCLMKPEKSLSFVCLVNRGGDFSGISLCDCKNCTEKNCSYRINS